jgi:hypothetical protein
VDLTDPYNIHNYGPVKNADGTDLLVFASDIKISKASGLAYLSTGNGVYVIDIKNPKDPKLLNFIMQTPTAPGSTTTSPLGSSTALVEKDGWVYLANPQKGLKVLDLDPKELGIESDSQYSAVRIPSTDYYPALGTKGVTIYGVISGLPLGNDWGLYLAEPSIDHLQIGGAVDSQGNLALPPAGQAFISRFTANDVDKKGYAPLYIHWNGSADSMPENFIIKLQARKIGATSLNDATSTKIYSFAFRRRHNGNVSFKEVLDGSAVYVADGIVSQSTSTVQRFAYVQELLNQVVPRMRQTYDGQQWVANQYNLVDEDGIYSAATYTAVKLFKQSFGIDANASDTYKKIRKDYGLDVTDANLGWFNKIIEKESLVGKKLQDADTVPNSAPNNTVMDTGLYELYKNVVERFVNAMINEGDRYRQSKGSDYQGANTSWSSRAIKSGATYTFNTVTESESYCFGCKNKYDDFWRIVSTCTPTTEGNINSAYARNVNDADCRLTGSKRYPGLFESEQKNVSTSPQYSAFDYWTGIDCAGFVQRLIMAGKQLALSGLVCKIPDLTEKDVNPVNHLDDGGIKSDEFFAGTYGPQRTTYWADPEDGQESVKLQKKLRRGDLVEYDGHISMIYSDRPTCVLTLNADGEEQTTCTYEIIHAYGGDTYKKIINGIEQRVFSRKVLVTPNDISTTISNPTGFGRIKLWD